MEPAARPRPVGMWGFPPDIRRFTVVSLATSFNLRRMWWLIGQLRSRRGSSYIGALTTARAYALANPVPIRLGESRSAAGGRLARFPAPRSVLARPLGAVHGGVGA